MSFVSPTIHFLSHFQSPSLSPKFRDGDINMSLASSSPVLAPGHSSMIMSPGRMTLALSPIGEDVEATAHSSSSSEVHMVCCTRNQRR